MTKVGPGGLRRSPKSPPRPVSQPPSLPPSAYICTVICSSPLSLPATSHGIGPDGHIVPTASVGARL